MAESLVLDLRRNDRGLEIALTAEAGRTVALVGPNGAGKSSVLHLAAGRLRPDAGGVRLGERTLDGAGSHVPVHGRGIALLSQRPLLFPHLSVADNVAFGLVARGVARREAGRRAASELEAVGCAELARRRTWELSGGQAQRVALARALAPDPSVVLLDEPMSALDVSTAPELRHLLHRRLAGRTVLIATHDLLDVLTLADEVAVLEGGRLAQRGAAADVLAHPRTDYAAALAGLNLLGGRAVASDALELATGERLSGIPDDPDAPPVPGDAVLATVAPDAVAVHLSPPGGSPRGVLAARVTSVQPRGPVVRVVAEAGGQAVSADITAAAAVELGLKPGVGVVLAIKATQVRLYPR